jgi:uncharacterized membrane protein
MSIFYPKTNKYSIHSAVLFVLFMSGLQLSATAQLSSKTYKASSFKSSLVNIEAAANETFRYNTTLQNGATESKIYQLQARIPEGWSITFTTMGSPVTSVQVEGGTSQDVTVELRAHPDSKPSKYVVPVTATTATDSLKLNLEAVLKGAYAVVLSTPTGRLSDDITEGSSKRIQLLVRNTATLPLESLELTAQNPSNWEVIFEPSKIERLDPGKTLDVVATIKVPDKTIVGDYIVTLSAKNANATTSATFRMMVKTSLLSGWIGILVMLLAVGLVYYLIRKYGRR